MTAFEHKSSQLVDWADVRKPSDTTIFEMEERKCSSVLYLF